MSTASKCLLLVFMFAAPAFAQNVRVDNVTFSSVQGFPFLPGATITICTAAATGLPCSPTVAGTCLSISDTTCNQSATLTSDALGNYGFWIQPGSYTYTVTKAGFGGFGPRALTLACQPTATCTMTAPQMINSNLTVSGTTTTANLNGTCVVSATQTLQSCINLFPSGNVEIHIPAGTFTTTSAITISGNGQSGIKIIGSGRGSVIQYTGGGAISAVLDIGTSTPTVQLLQGIVLRDFVVRGNANAVHAVRLQGVNSSTIQDVDGRDVTGSALQWLFGVGNVINHWITSPNDGIGSYSPTPTGCMELSELGANFGVSTTSVITPRCESVSGTAVLIKNGFDMSFSGCQISLNGTALDIEPSGFTPFPSTLQSNFNGCLFENSSNADGVIVHGRQTGFHECQIATSGTGKFHIQDNNTLVESSQIGTPGITIDSGVLNTHLKQLNMAPGNLTDNGSNTMLANNYNPLSNKQWIGALTPTGTFKQVIPTYVAGDGLVGGGGYDPMDHPLTGCWDFGTGANVLSRTPLTTGKTWRALFIGIWENNTDGAGLAQTPEIIEVTSAANTLAIGTAGTITFSVNGSGFFQGITAANNTSFCGTIYIQPNPNGVAGTASILVKDSIVTAGTMTPANLITANAGAARASFIDLGGSGIGASSFRIFNGASFITFISGTVPTIAAAGCGGGAASIVVANGTAAFKVNVGTTPGSACTLTFPAATTGWNVTCNDITTQSTAVFVQKQTGAESTTSVTITNFNDVAVATAFVASDILKCTAAAD